MKVRRRFLGFVLQGRRGAGGSPTHPKSGRSLVSAKLLPVLLSAFSSLAWADLAIVGGRVYTLESPEPLEGTTILVADGRIEAVGLDLPAPFAYRRIDATGKIVTPGLIESYSHLGLREIGLEASTDDAALLEYPLGPAFDVSYALNPASTRVAISRMEGVTRALTFPVAGVDPLAGLAAAVRLGGTFLLEPQAALVGYLDAAATDLVGGSRAAALQRLSTAFADATRFSPSRYRPGPGDYSRQDMAALKRFLNSGKPLVLAVDRAAEIRRAIDLAAAHDLPLVILGGAEAWKVRDALAAAAAAVAVRVHGNLPRSFDALGARLDNAALLHEAGVRVVFTGAGTYSAASLRQMAGNAVAHGLPWHSALAGLTRRAAETWGMEDAGLIRPGAAADLVVWSGDPLEVTTWPEQVVIGGELTPMRSRQTQLYERYRDLSKPYGYH